MDITVPATDYTFITTGQTDSLINSGNPIIVVGISTSGGTTNLEQSDGSTAIFDIITSATLNSAVLNNVWLADQGLAITTDGSATCTVFWRPN